MQHGRNRRVLSRGKIMERREPLLVNDKKAAELLSIGRSTLWRGVEQGIFPKPVKFGGITRWRVADLQQFVQNAGTDTEGDESGRNQGGAA